MCTPDDCTAVADKFPGAVAPLAPAGSGYPSFWNVLIIETVLVGAAEAYRTGVVLVFITSSTSSHDDDDKDDKDVLSKRKRAFRESASERLSKRSDLKILD